MVSFNLLFMVDLLEKEMATTLVFLPRKAHVQRNLVGYSPWGCKESDMNERLHFHFYCLAQAVPISPPGTLLPFWCM